jgi:hypothetical protein
MIWTQSNTPNWVPCLTDQAQWTSYMYNEEKLKIQCDSEPELATAGTLSTRLRRLVSMPCRSEII